MSASSWMVLPISHLRKCDLTVLEEKGLIAGDTVAMVNSADEIDIGVMVQQCLDRRIPDKDTLVAEVARWERRRNAEGAKIKWLFTVDRARQKMGRAYPRPTGHISLRSAA